MTVIIAQTVEPEKLPTRPTIHGICKWKGGGWDIEQVTVGYKSRVNETEFLVLDDLTARIMASKTKEDNIRECAEWLIKHSHHGIATDLLTAFNVLPLQ